MKAWAASGFDADDPVSQLDLIHVDDRAPIEGWVRVKTRMASLNHHDLWSLRGVGLREEQLPMVLGTDVAGVTDDGDEVIVHAVIPSPDWSGEETLDPKRTLLSEKYPGTLAEYVYVPKRNLVSKPEGMSWATAASLPTAWLTAYKMLFSSAGVQPGDTVLVQGAGGGVATAAVQLAAATGIRAFVTSRSAERGQRAVDLGAADAFETGERLPVKVDAVLDTVGEATWSHSLKSLRPGGTLVLTGTTSGANPPKGELQRLFFQQLRVIGSTMGSVAQLHQVTDLVMNQHLEPTIDQIFAFDDAKDAFTRLESGHAFGKVLVGSAEGHG